MFRVGQSASTAPADPRRSVPLHRIVFGVLFTAALALIAYLAWRGASYYLTPLIERPRHPDYWLLKPGGSWGRMYGIVGATLLVLMLTYTVRKRLRLLRKVGTLRAWLAFHIFCGVVGALLILLHTSFKFGGLVALSFWSMVVVALSGVLGRYLYRQIPRARGGDELSLEQAEAEEEDVAARLTELGVSAEALAHLEAIAGDGPRPETGLPALLLRLPFDDLRLRWRLGAVRRELLDGTPPRLRRQVLRLAGRKSRLRRRILLWRRLQQLFYYWHVLHKPFAIVMYLFMIVHVAVVTLAGYGLGAG